MPQAVLRTTALLRWLAIVLAGTSATIALGADAPTPQAPAAAAAPKPRIVTLASAIELALSNNSELASKLTQVAQAEAREAQAHAASYPKVIGQAILSPIYSATGNAVRSDNDSSKWGAWLQSTVTILQPIYTWGKLSSLREATAHGSEVARAQGRKDRNELVYQVKELFYGAVLAEQLYTFLEDGKNEVTEILKKAEEDQKKKRPSIAKRDFYRLKIFAAEADYRFEEAKKLRMLARHALSLRLGFDPDEETIPHETVLTPIETAPPTEDELANRMLDARPEFAQLKNGIIAKQALVASEKANNYPMVFAGGLLSFAYSNVRESQQSAYAFDPYNRNTGGVGVGVQWTWDFATTHANVSALRAEIDGLERLQSFAKSGFKMELKKSLAELHEARARLAASKEAFQIGKRWLVSETMGYSIGLTEVKNLIDAYLARAKTVKDHWEAIYRVNMTWADLTRTVGTEITPGLVAK